MGSGTSRGKKVAPACVSEVNAGKASASVASPKRDGRAFKPLQIHAILRNARNRAQPDCHSEGHDSEISAEDDDIDRGLDTVLADYEEHERSAESKPHPRRFFVRSKTYGLCHLRRGDADEPGGAASAEEPRGPRGGCADVNKASDAACERLSERTHPCSSQHSRSSQASLTGGPCAEAAPASQKQSCFVSCHSSSLTMPVILYDGSEEELMDTIEREFS